MSDYLDAESGKLKIDLNEFKDFAILHAVDDGEAIIYMDADFVDRLIKELQDVRAKMLPEVPCNN